MNYALGKQSFQLMDSNRNSASSGGRRGSVELPLQNGTENEEEVEEIVEMEEETEYVEYVEEEMEEDDLNQSHFGYERQGF